MLVTCSIKQKKKDEKFQIIFLDLNISQHWVLTSLSYIPDQHFSIFKNPFPLWFWSNVMC